VIHAVVSDRYRAAHVALINDPIIIALAKNLPPDFIKFTDWGFVIAASRAYHNAGGTNAVSVGGPADAIAVVHDHIKFMKANKVGAYADA
jgi:hypothetical protein